MSRRRRKPVAAVTARRDQETTGLAQQVAGRLRRPTKGHTAKRARTAGGRRPPRGRGSRHACEVELGVGETDGFADLDEVVFVGPRTGRGQVVPLAPEADPQMESAVVARLLRKRLPALELEWMPGEWLDIKALGSTRPLVMYCQPGIEPHTLVVEDEEDERMLGADAAECRAFADHDLELTAMSHRVVGVSSQSSDRQLGLATQEALPHIVLSDRRLELAEEMGLPTFELDGVCLYERLTLVVREGRVEKVFYPIPDPVTHAAEVAEWLREGGG